MKPGYVFIVRFSMFLHNNCKMVYMYSHSPGRLAYTCLFHSKFAKKCISRGSCSLVLLAYLSQRLTHLHVLQQHKQMYIQKLPPWMELFTARRPVMFHKKFEVGICIRQQTQIIPSSVLIALQTADLQARTCICFRFYRTNVK